MSAERKRIDPVDTEHITDDFDRESLDQISDISMRLNRIAYLNSLETDKKHAVHIDSIVKSIDPTQDHVFFDETEKLHNGDIHYNQEGITFEPQPEVPKVEPTFAQRTNARGRRRTRAIGNRLLRGGR